jgi:murein DD-endopeptidase MepM/ murein hydrolase activator NlpD
VAVLPLALAGLVMAPVPVLAQSLAAAAQTAPAEPTYADLATLSDAADLVIHAKIRKTTALPAERAPGLAPGFARLYIEATTIALIAGRSTVGAGMAYLVDVPLDAKSKVPKLKNAQVVLFADPVAGRAGEVRLVAPGAQLPYTPALEGRLRPILTELYAAEGAPPRITGISDALAVPGTLAGESETQIFLATEDRSPVSLTILRRPGEADSSGVRRPGILISTRPQALVTAPWPGTIRYRGQLADYGNVMILEPANGYLLILAGLGTVYGEVGEVVSSGAPLGLMGGTEAEAAEFLGPAQEGSGAGGSETLYVEMRQGAEPVDPTGWFAGTRE